MKPTKKVIAALASVLMLAVPILCLTLFERRSITILNANPYPCVVAARYRTAPNTWNTVGWFPLGPGERKTISAIFFRVKPEFYVAAESRDRALLSWLTQGGDGVIYFVGDDLSAQLPKNRDINLAEVEDKNLELEEAKFSRAKTDDEIHLLTDPLFHDAILRNEGVNYDEEEKGYELIREKAVQLYDSLHRQKRFEETFKTESDYPFKFEFGITDEAEYGFMYLGVTLTEVLSHTLHGDEIQLKTGDVLIGIGSGDDPVTPIFAPADAYVALHEFALDSENGGITNPLTFIVMRNGELLQVQSYYIFNPNFMWDDVSAGRAFLEGGADFLTLGLWPRLVGLFSSDPKAAWKTSQRLCRLKQFHPGATFAGQIATVMVPLPTKFLRIGRGGWLAKTFSSPVVEGISVELLRAAIYKYSTSVSSPQAKPTTNNDLTKLFASANPPNMIEGLNEEGVEASFKQRRHAFGVTR
jgi:hypothetical protein